MQCLQYGLQLLHFFCLDGAKLHSMPLTKKVMEVRESKKKKFSNKSTWRMLQVNNYL